MECLQFVGVLYVWSYCHQQMGQKRDSINSLVSANKDNALAMACDHGADTTAIQSYNNNPLIIIKMI